jgi:transcription elongation GreA/GreB family factor
VNKAAVVKKIIDHLNADLELYFKAAKAAHFEATHEQSKAENKYDTRGLEASYLARGQSRQAAELEQSLHQFRALVVRPFGVGAPIDVGALVELGVGQERAWYFVGPRAGGTEIQHAGHEITVITTQSPIGQQLVGRKQGDVLKLDFGSRGESRVVSVS